MMHKAILKEIWYLNTGHIKAQAISSSSNPYWSRNDVTHKRKKGSKSLSLVLLMKHSALLVKFSLGFTNYADSLEHHAYVFFPL